MSYNENVLKGYKQVIYKNSVHTLNPNPEYFVTSLFRKHQSTPNLAGNVAVKPAKSLHNNTL